MQWHEVDLGAGWAQEAVEERVRDRASVMWAVEGSMYGRARGAAKWQHQEPGGKGGEGSVNYDGTHVGHKVSV